MMLLNRRAGSIAAGELTIPVAAFLVSVFVAEETQAQWTQFGGPGQSFKADSGELAKEWPVDGPPKLWSRGLGEGYSSILADDGRLYTMYRVERTERVISLDAATGKTLWEYGYDSWPWPQHEFGWGNGPNATPLLTGGRLYTISITGLMHCFDAATGKVIWSRALWKEARERHPHKFGYSSSPIEYKDTIITAVGERNRSIVALNKGDGRVVYQSLDYPNSYATPTIVKIHGEDQLIAFTTVGVIGADPRTGAFSWEYPIANHYEENISAPVFVGDDMLFVATLDAGSRGLKLKRRGQKTVVEEVWSTPKIRVTYGGWVCIDDHLYGCAGQIGNFLFAGVHAKTGKIAWRKRGFGQSHLVYADGRFIVLDEDGILTLATPSPEELTVQSRVKLLEAPSRTPPTIVGKTLFVRDCKHIMALDLG
ncbi:MAG: PQQ-binding-like beta-propeller repeat protein [Phycisphaerales bacterium]|nr:MAG: PQQ-binding-like beta-propeller repeat protein [Phycisphaerales bacterium]